MMFRAHLFPWNRKESVRLKRIVTQSALKIVFFLTTEKGEFKNGVFFFVCL